MSLVLTQHQPPPGRISLAGITPDRLAELGREQIERLPLQWGRESFALAEFFRVSGTPGDALVLRGADRRFCDVGGGMAGGQLMLEGAAGDRLASGMQGGRVLVQGHAGDFAACGMSGGEVHVLGNAGDHLGAAMPWQGAGMSGGRVVVQGDAGARCGDRMRRGEIFIAGSAGDFCAARMVAGSIVVAGGTGAHTAYAMRRGTLLLLGTPFMAGPTFVQTVMCADAYLGLVWRDWQARFAAPRALSAATGAFGAFARRALQAPMPVRRWMGDLATDGRGEVFTFGA